MPFMQLFISCLSITLRCRHGIQPVLWLFTIQSFLNSLNCNLFCYIIDWPLGICNTKCWERGKSFFVQSKTSTYTQILICTKLRTVLLFLWNVWNWNLFLFYQYHQWLYYAEVNLDLSKEIAENISDKKTHILYFQSSFIHVRVLKKVHYSFPSWNNLYFRQP